MRLPSFFGWYRILRGSYHLSVFEAVRSSLMAGALVRLGHRNQQQLRLRLRNRGRWADGTIGRFSPVPVSRAVRRSVSRVSLVRLSSLGETR
jgi:hypothetical protein